MKSLLVIVIIGVVSAIMPGAFANTPVSRQHFIESRQSYAYQTDNVNKHLTWDGSYSKHREHNNITGYTMFCFEAPNLTGHNLRVNSHKLLPGWYLQYCTNGNVSDSSKPIYNLHITGA